MRIPIQPPLPAAHIHAESPVDSETVSVLMAGLLIPGRGEPIRNGALAIRAGKIEWVGSYTSMPSK